jgi:glycosyl transferase family 25
MRVFVINLVRSTDRKQYMHQQFHSLGIPFEFIEAVDAANLSDETIEQMQDSAHADFLSRVMRRGSYACLLSHHSIFKKMVAEQIPYAAIFEDDAGLSPDFKTVLTTVEPQLCDNEIVLFYSHNNYQKTTFSKQHAVAVGARQLVYTMDVWSHSTAAGYIVTLAAAKQLLTIDSNVQMPFDAWGSYYDKGYIAGLRCIIPFPVTPGKFESEINYVKGNSLMGKVRELLHKYKFLPITKILEYRRNRYVKQYSAYTLTNEISPLVNKKY